MKNMARLLGLMILPLFILALSGVADVSWGATPQVAAGGNHTVTLKADGSIWAWGENTFGQVGDGTVISRNAPVRVGTSSNWTDVSAGFYHTLALKADGTLWAWGDNSKGQLGDGSVSFSQPVPVRIGTDANWDAVAAGDFHSLALKTDGTLWAWGDNTSGQVGDGSVVPDIQPVPVKIGTDIDWVIIAAGGSHSLALKLNHTLWGWGSNSAGQLGNGTNVDAVAPVQIVLLAPFINTDWITVTAGELHTVALKANGSLWAWGSNTFGQLGNGTILNSNFPVREANGATNWVSVTAGDTHTVGRQSNSTLWAWGGNLNGQLGNGTNADAHAPVKVGVDTDWAEAAAGSIHSVARKINGTVWGWGDNTFGQLGDGTNGLKIIPTQIAFNVTPPLPLTVTQLSSPATPQFTGTPITFTATGSGGTGPIQYQFWLRDTSGVYTLAQAYSASNVFNWVTTALPAGAYFVAVQAKTAGSTAPSGFDAESVASFVLQPQPAATLNIVTTPTLPTVAFTATASGGSGPYLYQFWVKDTTGVYTLAQAYSASNVLSWDTTGKPAGVYNVAVQAKSVGSSPASGFDVENVVSYVIASGILPATAVNVVTTPGTPIVAFTATASGGSGTYEYQFWVKDTTGVYTLAQAYSASNVFNWVTTGLPAGTYFIAVQAKSVGSISINGFDVEAVVNFVLP